LVRVMEVPDRFVSGESGALISAMNGRQPLPPSRRTHASHRGLGARPTLLCSAETSAQLAVLGMLGPEGYATTGDPAEPGTVLLTVTGAVARAAVVEVPSGWRLGDVLGMCGAQAAEGVLVGGYQGSWLAGDAAYEVPVSRAGLEAFGGFLGQGAVFVLGQESCSLAELARAAAYLTRESSGRCGACRRSLLSLTRSLAALAAGSGGGEALDAARCPGPARPRHVFSPGRRGQVRAVRPGCVRRRPGLARAPVRLWPASRPRPAAAFGARRSPAGHRLEPLPGTWTVRSDRAGTCAAGRPGLPGNARHARPALAGAQGRAIGWHVPGTCPHARPGRSGQPGGPVHQRGGQPGRRAAAGPRHRAQPGHRRFP